MGLADVLERSVGDARRIKEYVCRQSPHNIRRLVTWYRGDQSVALAVMLDSDRYQLLDVTGMGTYGFGADAITLASDSWVPAKIPSVAKLPADAMRAMSEEEVAAQTPHPVTGRPLEQGDLSKLAEEGGVEKGLVAEALMIQATSRAGYQRGTLLEFRYASKRLVWGEERYLLDEGKGTETDVMRGEISDHLVSQMNQPTLQQVQVDKGMDFDLRERDILTAGLIHARKLPVRVVLLPEGADHLRVLRQNNLLSGW